MFGGYRAPSDMYTHDKDTEDEHISSKGSLYSRLAFQWFDFIIQLAQKRVLKESDATTLPASVDGKLTRTRLWAVWSEPERYTGDKRLLLQAIIEIYGMEYLVIGIYLFFASICSFLGPVLLHRLVVLAQDNTSNTFDIILCAFYLFLSRLIAAICNTQYTFKTGILSVQVGAAIKGCLFQKVLSLSTKSRRAYTTGMLSNLYTTDVERITDLIPQAHRFWALPLQIIISMLLLYSVVGIAMFYGLTTIIIILIFNNYIAKLSKIENDKLQACKDIRMSTISACFSSSLVIKLNTWEKQFLDRINLTRKNELVHVWTCLLIFSVNICLLWLAPCLVSSATIAAYGSAGDVHAAEIFTSLSLFKSLQDPFRDLPGIITQYFQMKTSLQRLQILFEMPEKIIKQNQNNDNIPPPKNQAEPESMMKKGSIKLGTCTFNWDTTRENIPNNVLCEDGKEEVLNDDSVRNIMDKSTVYCYKMKKLVVMVVMISEG